MNLQRRLGLRWPKKKDSRISLNFAGSSLSAKASDVKCISCKNSCHLLTKPYKTEKLWERVSLTSLSYG